MLLWVKLDFNTLILTILLEPSFDPQVKAFDFVVAKNLPSICPLPKLNLPVDLMLLYSASLTARYSLVVDEKYFIAPPIPPRIAPETKPVKVDNPTFTQFILLKPFEIPCIANEVPKLATAPDIAPPIAPPIIDAVNPPPKAPVIMVPIPAVATDNTIAATITTIPSSQSHHLLPDSSVFIIGLSPQ